VIALRLSFAILISALMSPPRVRDRTIVPFGRIADVYSNQSLIEKLFNVNSLVIDDTGASTLRRRGRPTLRMQGLTNKDCEKAMHLISEHLVQK